MSSSSSFQFVVNIATDVGNGKINTGINFYSRPISARQVIVAAEELYTAELREFNLRRGGASGPHQSDRFVCVLALIMNKNAASMLMGGGGGGGNGGGGDKWQEFTDPSQLYPNCQLYVFDNNSPPPERGTVIPRAQLVIDADRIPSVAVSTLMAAGGRESYQSNNNNTTTNNYTRGLSTASSSVAIAAAASSNTGAVPQQQYNQQQQQAQTYGVNAAVGPSFQQQPISSYMNHGGNNNGGGGGIEGINNSNVVGRPPVNNNNNPYNYSNGQQQQQQQQFTHPTMRGASTTAAMGMNGNDMNNEGSSPLPSYQQPMPYANYQPPQPQQTFQPQPMPATAQATAPLPPPPTTALSRPSSTSPTLQTSASNVAATQPVDRAATRQYLFRQLRDRCVASGQSNYPHNDSIPAQSLHGVLVQNEMFFATDVFAEMTGGKSFISARDWSVLEEHFAPVLDVLYDRIAAKTALKNQHGEEEDRKRQADRMRNRMDELAEEEAKLMARQAAIREEMTRLKRDVQKFEQQEKAAKDEKAKEWDVLNKYVVLKLRQHKLRREEMQINHQLALL